MTAEGSLEQSLTLELAEALRRSGARIRREKALAGRRFDLLIDHQGHQYAVEIRGVTLPRTVALVGTLAVALLDVRKSWPSSKVKPLIIIGSRVITDEQVGHLRALMKEHADGTAWGVIDSTGLLELHGPGLEAIRQSRRPRRSRPLVAPAFNPFSDRGQWMLKRLVNHRLPPPFQVHDLRPDQDRHLPFQTAAKLARAGNSVAQASKLVAYLRAEGFLTEGRPLEIIRFDELLHRWRAAMVSNPAREIGARWLIPRANPGDQLTETVAAWEHFACIGLFDACARLGLGFVKGVAPTLYVRELSDEVLRKLRLVPAEPGEKVAVFVRAAPFPESIFQSTLSANGVPVTDIIQCWLDVVDHPARGEEMGALLYKRVLAPALIGPRR